MSRLHFFFTFSASEAYFYAEHLQLTQHQLHMQEKSIDSATAGCSSSAACASSELSQHQQHVLEKSVDSASAVCSSSAACSSSATSPHELSAEEHVDLQKGLYASLATGVSARQENLELASEGVVIAASIIEHQGPSIGLKLITIGGESREITILASSTIKDLYSKVALEYKIKPKDVQLAVGKREIPHNRKNGLVSLKDFDICQSIVISVVKKSSVLFQ